MELQGFVADFAACLWLADSKRPCAANARSKVSFQAGIGPHAESAAIKLIAEQLEQHRPEVYRGRIATSVCYPETRRQRCDLCIRENTALEWAIEVKLLRFFGDNGKLNDNMLMHVLSPYPAHRSAVTDCIKLSETSLARKKAILIYGFDHEGWLLDPAIDAFEALAGSKVNLGARTWASFDALVHPIHERGRVFAWAVQGPI